MTVNSKQLGAVWLALALLMGVSPAHAGRSSQTAAFTGQLAQADVSLTEKADYVGACRGSGATALTLFEDSRKTKVVGTVPAGVVVTLTGVVGNGVVLIRNPSVGWIESTTLTTNCTAGGQTTSETGPLPADIDVNPLYCRRLRSSAIDGPDYRDLDAGLAAFDRPGSSLQTAFGSADGPARGATVRITRTPPETQTYSDRTWIRVKYTSQLGTQRVGWISNGAIGSNRNLGYCL